MSEESAKPGYYPDPNTGQPRWWDGTAWGPPVPPAAPQPGAKNEGEYQGGLVVGGYVLAVLIPFIGFILGIVVATRQGRATSKHGIWIILLSTLVFFVGLAVLFGGSDDSDLSSY